MDVMLNAAASHVVSPHIGRLCDDDAVVTYARSSDLRLLAQSKYPFSLLALIIHTVVNILMSAA